MQLVECVPNFSEGRRPEVVAAIRDAAASVPDAHVLDTHMDSAHNRAVITIAGTVHAVLDSAFRSVQEATYRIDMRGHQGEHPRMGAADVVPFVPLGDTDMSTCVEMARSLGRRLGDELALPVFLYGEACTRPDRRRLVDVRRPQFEGLQTLVGADPAWRPDFGPSRLGPAGAVAVGARGFLVAFNVNLASSNLQVAQAIARRVRASSGGLPGVQALGMRTTRQDVVQVSMNLVDLNATPLHFAFHAVEALAREHDVLVLESELVGLAPTRVFAETTRSALRVRELGDQQTIEARLLWAWTQASERG